MLSTLPAIVLGYIWTSSEYSRFTEQAKDWRETYIESRRTLLRREVEKAVEYIEFKRAAIDKQLYAELRKELAGSLGIVRTIYDETGGKATVDQLLASVVEALDKRRFKNEAGYFVLAKADGTLLLPPLQPQTRKRLSTGQLPDFLAALKTAVGTGNQGGFSYSFDHGGGEPNQSENISLNYAYYISGLDAYLVASAFKIDEQNQVKQEVLERLAAVPYDPESSILYVTDESGIQRVNAYSPDKVGKRITLAERSVRSYNADSEHKPLSDAQLKAAIAEGAFVEAEWQRQDKNVTSPIVSYLKKDSDWGWTIGAGAFLDEVNIKIEEERLKLRDRVIEQIRFVVLILIILVIAAVLVSRRLAAMNAQGFQVFQQFFAGASRESISIDLDRLPFVEFEQMAENANYMVSTRSETEKALKLSEQHFKLALDASQNHPWELDLSTYQMKLAKGLFQQLGQPDASENQSLDQFVRLCHPDDQELIKETSESWGDGDSSNEVEFRIADAQGHYHWIHSRGDVVETDAQGKPVLAMGVMTDTTSRKQMEQDLINARISAEDANHAKSQFLSSVSHELRTPLNGVLGYSQLMLRDSNTTEQGRAHLKAIENCGEHLLNLINDVLDLAKIESGNVEVEHGSHNLRDLLSSVGDIVRQRAVSKGLECNIKPEDNVPRWVVADAVKLRQVLVNLLDNAVKFTAKGKVELRVEVTKNHKIRFVVSDTGMGIPEDQLDQIFQPFRQVKRNDGMGTGLGLAICNRLCEAMGGTLEVSSVMGEGSQFEFSVPLMIADADVEQASAGLSGEGESSFDIGGLSGLKILVADDNPMNRQVLCSMVSGVCGEVVEASSGRETIEILEAEPVDVVLMDLRMPDINGLQAARLIKSNADLHKIRIIMVSASTESEVMREAISVGCEAFITKPVKLNEILSILCSLFPSEASEEKLLSSDDSVLADAPESLGAEEDSEPSDNSAESAETEADGQSELHITEEQFEQMESAAGMGDIGLVRAVLEELQAEPNNRPFVQRVSSYLDDFELIALQTFLEESKELALGNSTSESNPNSCQSS